MSVRCGETGRGREGGRGGGKDEKRGRERNERQRKRGRGGGEEEVGVALKVLENEGDGGIEAWLWRPAFAWKGKYFIIEKLRLNGNVSLFTPRRHIKVRARPSAG